MTHHWCVVTHIKGCHGSAGMPSFRHDGDVLRRDAPQYKCCTRVRHDGVFLRCDAPQYKCYTRVRHGGAFLRRNAPQYNCCTRCVMTEDIMRRDAPQYKCCTRCVVTEEIVRHDGILYKELYEYVRRDAKSLRHDARTPGDFGCSSAMTDHGLRLDGLYTFTV